jgi:hypothetical protein
MFQFYQLVTTRKIHETVVLGQQLRHYTCVPQFMNAVRPHKGNVPSVTALFTHNLNKKIITGQNLCLGFVTFGEK